eukprot:gnl/TRDRNA2_/TRDRNA2_66971_c1_seq1.p1 gnl/TRDRNA2_/TRDRNA2_66971_c1~~gnl/TRDRNA2_/TRDRNA2_66971_c1_seq1.p1  ORF type:complete len:345 (+),score=68.18 gnl/TRDRNA2_/TRDRNA2_66971_c1_seq1:143-1036(+)
MLAADLFAGATSAPGVGALWPIHLQARWMGLAPHIAPQMTAGTGISLMVSLSTHRAHELVPYAATLLGALHCMALGEATSAAAALAGTLIPEVRRNLFRLNLSQANAVLESSLRLAAKLRLDEATSLPEEVLAFATTAVQSLPAKFRSESVFHKKGEGGVRAADVVAWCRLLADVDLLSEAGAKDVVSESAWQHLAVEACQVVAMGQLDEEASALLSAFAAEASRRPDWDAADPASPVGALAAAIAKEWARAITCDGELEDPMHEPLPIPESTLRDFHRLFGQLGLPLPPLVAGMDK